MENIKKYFKLKKLLYTLCFVAFMLIDWTRGSQVGSTWAWTVNITGLVMAILLFSAYNLREFMRPIYIIYSLACGILILISYYWWNLHQAVIYRDKLLTAVLNVWLLGIFLIKMFLDAVIYRTKKMQFNKTEFLAALMLFCMLFSQNEDVWPIWYLIMFGIFYHTEYSQNDLIELEQGMLNGIIIAFFLLQGAAFIFRPFDDPHGRYCGIYANCNINAMFYGIVWIAFLIKLFDIRRNYDKKYKKLFCFIFTGVLAAFSILTISKTAWVSMLITGFFYIIFADFHYLEYKAGKILENLMLYVAVVMICTPIVYGAVRYLPPIFHHPVWYEGEYSEERVHSWDSWDSEKYVSWEELSEGITERIKPYINIIFGKIQMKVQAAENVAAINEEKDMRVYQDFSSALGRVAYWKYYLRNGNLKGHLSSEGHDLGVGFYVWHAQNMFIQLWYYYGIPSAILFLIVLVRLIFYSIKKVIQKKTGVMICLLYLIFFAMYGLFEATWYPGQMILLLAFFVPKFLITIDGKNEI